jgi:ribosomal-protein-alanine N-acetyltransferase
MTINRVHLETDRLFIRDHIASDLEDLETLISDKANMTYIMDIYAKDREAVEKNLKTAMGAIVDPLRDKYFFAIVEKAFGNYVGEIGFTLLDEGLAELGYFIKQAYWNRGYVTEAGEAVLEFAFCNLGLHKMVTGCVKENGGSERVMIKLGFSKEGELKEHQMVQGEWKDRVIYGYLKNDYLKQYRSQHESDTNI